MPVPQSASQATSAAAASALPPASPPASGICLRRCSRACAGTPAALASTCAARITRLVSSSASSPAPSPSMVSVSWSPRRARDLVVAARSRGRPWSARGSRPARSGPTPRCRLIFAGTRTRTGPDAPSRAAGLARLVPVSSERLGHVVVILGGIGVRRLGRSAAIAANVARHGAGDLAARAPRRQSITPAPGRRDRHRRGGRGPPAQPASAARSVLRRCANAASITANVGLPVDAVRRRRGG